MRKWKCVKSTENWFRVNKIYESDDSGYCLKDELGYKWSCHKMWEIKEYVEFEEVKEENNGMKFKVGDRVKIIERLYGHDFSNGEIVVIREVREDESNYKAYSLSGKDYWFIRDDEIELANNQTTFTIIVSDSITTLKSDDMTVSVNRLHSDKYNPIIALKEVVNKYEAEIKRKNKPTCGKDLIGFDIPKGTKFKVINVEPHRGNKYVCLDEYIGKVAKFNRSFTFSNTGYETSGIFEKPYIDAIDEENGYLVWRYDEVEILWEDK